MSTDTDGAPPSVAPESRGDPGAAETVESGAAWLQAEIQRRMAAARGGAGGRHARHGGPEPAQPRPDYRARHASDPPDPTSGHAEAAPDGQGHPAGVAPVPPGQGHPGGATPTPTASGHPMDVAPRPSGQGHPMGAAPNPPGATPWSVGAGSAAAAYGVGGAPAADDAARPGAHTEPATPAWGTGGAGAERAAGPTNVDADASRAGTEPATAWSPGAGTDPATTAWSPGAG
ncbi:MAG TPA: hypothetical protein VHS35_25295, partial [Pseudonocardia sp.]|nr:hypothetical protein [Pseudonocardia sp.]